MVVVFSYYDFPENFEKEYEFCGAKKAIQNLSLALAKLAPTFYVSLGNSHQFKTYSNDELKIAMLPGNRPTGLLKAEVLEYLRRIKDEPVITDCSGMISHFYLRKFIQPSKTIYISYGSNKEFALKDVISLRNKIKILVKGHLQEIMTLRLNNVVVALTVDGSEELKKYVCSEKVMVVHHGVDVDRYKPKSEHSSTQRGDASIKYGVDQTKFTVLATGRISYENNFHNVIRVFSSLTKKFNEDVQLVIAGTTQIPLGDSIGIKTHEYARYLRRLSAKYGILNLVKIIENVPEMEMPLIYSLGDIFVQFTEGYSPLPNVILEAAASGLPLVLTYHVARDNILEEGENGFYVSAPDPRTNPAKVAEAIGYILQDANTRKRMARRSRILARKHFNLAKIAQKILNIAFA